MGYFKALLALAVFLIMSSPAQAEEKKLLVFGDSLVSGYNLPLDQAFPAQLEKKLRAEGYAIKVINGGVSGDTTSGGLTRVDWALADHPDYAIVVLGGNDMMRAIDPKVTRENLKKILEKFREKKVPVLLAGMRSFKNLGEIFGGSYQKMYKELAEEYGAVYYPFFLDGVALDASLNLADGIHPNQKGVEVIVGNIFDDVEDLLDKEVE